MAVDATVVVAEYGWYDEGKPCDDAALRRFVRDNGFECATKLGCWLMACLDSDNSGDGMTSGKAADGTG